MGASARYTVAWARLCAHSGMPTCSTAWAAATAIVRAWGSALPMSSLARITIRRAMKRGSSPPSIITARYSSEASGSEPRVALIQAEMVS